MRVLAQKREEVRHVPFSILVCFSSKEKKQQWLPVTFAAASMQAQYCRELWVKQEDAMGGVFESNVICCSYKFYKTYFQSDPKMKI